MSESAAVRGIKDLNGAIEPEDKPVVDVAIANGGGAKLKLAKPKGNTVVPDVELQCPKCKNILKSGHILCIDCGVNAETGKKIHCKKGFKIVANTSFDRNEHVGVCRKTYAFVSVILWLTVAYSFVFFASPDLLQQMGSLEVANPHEAILSLSTTFYMILGLGISLQLILDIQRMRNTGSSGWLVFIYLIPLGAFWVLYRLCCCPEDYRFNHHLDKFGKALLMTALIMPLLALGSLVVLV